MVWWREFEIAKQNNLLLIPVGATGYVAKELWQEIIDNLSPIIQTMPN